MLGVDNEWVLEKAGLKQDLLEAVKRQVNPTLTYCMETSTMSGTAHPRNNTTAEKKMTSEKVIGG